MDEVKEVPSEDKKEQQKEKPEPIEIDASEDTPKKEFIKIRETQSRPNE
ncbi:MAG: hypothetical protein NZ853_09680 [Leptospiraceae bacterium]|nr:hypothetical protein [Leptospiraceae bacterium]MDW7976965.1 hypothetical protein [Leptospiraceae bacterium]